MSVPAARRDSDACTRPRFLRNRPSGGRPRPGPRPRPSDQATDSRETEGLADVRQCIVAVACQCVCSLPIPTGRLDRCRLLPSLRPLRTRLSIELPVDYARDSCSPAASRATTDSTVHIPLVSTEGPSSCICISSISGAICGVSAAAANVGTYHEFSKGKMVDRIATDLCLISIRSHRLTQLDHRLHDRLQLLDAEEGLAVCDKRKHCQLAAEVAGCRQRGVTGAVWAACGGQSVHALQQPCRRCARQCGHHIGNVVHTRVAAHITLWSVETARCVLCVSRATHIGS